MASFRSNLNSVSSTHDGLAAAQSRLTTCFNHLHCKFVKTEQQTQQETLHEEYRRHFQKRQQQRGPHLKWLKGFKDSRLLKKAEKNLRNWTVKLKEIFSNNFQFSTNGHRESQHPDWEQNEIVENLLSSTLITPQTAVPFNTNGKTAPNEMIIMGDSFFLLREEYPDIDAEIRSILISRAQTGATIAEIKEDYRKNTGLRFPVYENITDFLLCIPGVMVYCNEIGTRIFHVRPTEKTRHIFDLVMQQKAPSERKGSTGHSHGLAQYRERKGSAGHSNGLAQYSKDNEANSNMALPTWHIDNFFAQTVQDADLPGSLISSSFKNQQQQGFLQPPNSVDDNSTRCESDGLVENRGGYYQDNCQYLFNRIYNYENNKDIISENSDPNYNNVNMNINENPHAIAAGHANTRNQIEVIQSDQIDKDMHLFKRPMNRDERVPNIRASSPSGTRSSQRSDSAYLSDMEYEAHLLDFPLLGDDFFLYLARMELKCKFKRQQKVLQSGLCVSGQTIKAAIKRMRSLPHNNCANRRIIVNIGSVDIMQGRHLVQIEHEFRTLLYVLTKRGFEPILTTLAPLANYSHDVAIKTKVERFNEFIKREGQGLLVFDIFALFVNERKQTLFDCYQNEPRQVTGAMESYVFWNKIGRQRVLQLIESNLEY